METLSQVRGKKSKRKVATERKDEETCERKGSDRNTRIMEDKKKASKKEHREGKAKNDGEEPHSRMSDSEEVSKEEADISEGDNSVDESTAVKLAKKEDDGEGSDGVQEEEESAGSAVVTEASFESLGLCDPLAKACNTVGWKTATRIQKEVLPYALKGRDIIGLAETGSGKTGQFSFMRFFKMSANTC
jgi:DEAD/DEAH box helicase